MTRSSVTLASALDAGTLGIEVYREEKRKKERISLDLCCREACEEEQEG